MYPALLVEITARRPGGEQEEWHGYLRFVTDADTAIAAAEPRSCFRRRSVRDRWDDMMPSGNLSEEVRIVLVRSIEGDPDGERSPVLGLRPTSTPVVRWGGLPGEAIPYGPRLDSSRRDVVIGIEFWIRRRYTPRTLAWMSAY